MAKQKMMSIEERIPKLQKLRKKKANRRLLVLLAVFFLLVLLAVYLQSSWSKVNNIEVQGGSLISKEEVIAKSGIETGTSIWMMGKSKAEEILASDERIKEASVSVLFPNDVLVDITEQREIAYAAQKGGLFPVLETGEILPDAVSGAPQQLPILYGFKEGEALKLFAKAAGSLPESVYNSLSEVYHEPTKSDALHIKAFMTDGFEVSATLSTFAEKMVFYPSISNQLDPSIKGIIDLEVGAYFKPYHPPVAEEVTETNVPESETP